MALLTCIGLLSGSTQDAYDSGQAILGLFQLLASWAAQHASSTAGKLGFDVSSQNKLLQLTSCMPAPEQDPGQVSPLALEAPVACSVRHKLIVLSCIRCVSCACVDALALLPLGSAACGHEVISLGVIARAWLLFLPALPSIAGCMLLLSDDLRPDMGGASLFSLAQTLSRGLP